jgi:serpin B
MTKLTRRVFLSAVATATAGTFAPRLWSASPTLEWAETAAAAGNTVFALDLYGQLRSEKGNVFCAPFSIAITLGMTSAGAKGRTLEQMQHVLHLPTDHKKAHAGLRGLLRQITETGKQRGYELAVANAIWAQQGYPWRNEFTTLLHDTYQAGIQLTDFATDPEAARQAINAWVATRTRHKITELFMPGILDELTRMVLANAVYFKGNWAVQFVPEQTQNLPFTLMDGTQVTTPFMFRSGRSNLLATSDFQALELPYVGAEVSMLVFLPRQHDTLPPFEEQLRADHLAAWSGQFHPVPDLQVFLPKFQIATQYTLNKALGTLGMTEAFDPLQADFTNMVTRLPENNLSISAVVHKAFVDVHEEGTEAAAATGVVLQTRSLQKAEPQVFRADHPFLFLIRHNPTGIVLFLGRVENPQARG